MNSVLSGLLYGLVVALGALTVCLAPATSAPPMGRGVAQPKPPISRLPVQASGVIPPKNVVTRINPKDGAEMVWVPPGELMMGSNDGAENEGPVHKVRITRGFWIYRAEVSTLMFARFRTGSASPIRRIALTFDMFPEFNAMVYPAIGWTFANAEAYATWAGGRLPTEAEWEYAARGPESRPFPWGTAAPTPELAVFGAGPHARYPAAVGTRPLGSSWCGALDLVGNVWEWCSDWYDEKFYTSPAASGNDPVNTTPGTQRVIRGAGWAQEGFFQRASIRRGDDPKQASYDVAFRVVVDGPPPTEAELANPAPLRVYPNQPELPEDLRPRPANPATRQPAYKPPYLAKINSVDGAVVLWVPEGPFTVGTDGGPPTDGPAHQVRMRRGFWIYRTEVTVRMYQMFCWATNRAAPQIDEPSRFGNPDQPVTGVSWDDAWAYARWAKAALPTEAQLEYAARGASGMKHPWGADEPAAKFAVFGLPPLTGAPSPVGSAPAGISPYGALDLAGNVMEWCRDGWDPSYYSNPEALRDSAENLRKTPLRPVRGGSWASPATDLPSTRRFAFDPNTRSNEIGFRCNLE